MLAVLSLRAQSPAWDYQAKLDPGATTLTVEARFAAEDSDRFTVDDDFVPFVRAVEIERNGHWDSVAAQGEGWRMDGAEARGAHLRWRFDLVEAGKWAGKSRHMMSGVGGRDGTYLAKPSAFLLRPDHYLPERRARLRMEVPEGLGFISGLRPGAEPGSYEASTDDFNDPPYSAIGRWEIRAFDMGGARIEWARPPGLPLEAAQAEAWLRASTGIVAEAYGRFPTPRAAIILVGAGRGRGVVFGTASGHGGAGILALVGKSASEAELASDWVLPHELIHLALPDLDRRHHWLEEGIPTYLEPLLRLRAGHMKDREFWAELRRQLPKGQPASGDRGLDRTPTWGRTYWGGALFCFLADLQIRERSGGRKTLLDALRGINAAGGSIETRWAIREVLRAGDKALGFKVLEPLYQGHAFKAEAVDLEAIWKRLGVAQDPFEDTAPEAALRKGWGR